MLVLVILTYSSDYGDLLDKAETESGAAEPNDDADHEDTDMSLLDANGYDHVTQAESQQQV